MSKYAHEPMSFQGLKTVGIHARGGKVQVAHFAKPYTGGGVSGLLDGLPHILAADSFRSVVDALVNARARKKMILWGLGGHVIKCGLAPDPDRSHAPRLRDRVCIERRRRDSRFRNRHCRTDQRGRGSRASGRQLWSR